jgi:hypothetical protein
VIGGDDRKEVPRLRRWVEDHVSLEVGGEEKRRVGRRATSKCESEYVKG